jgi:hypothetical protein
MKNIRKFILYLYILIPAIINGQEWQCFKSGITSNYINKQGDFRTIHFDSIATFDDYSYYRNFQSLVTSTGQILWDQCYIPGPSWIGKYMLKDELGNCFFFTKEDDTIHFKTNASPGESWIFAQNDSIRIYAFISAAEIRNILGMPDSTKTISFQSFNNESDSIFNPMNSVVLELSKDHGLINSFDFYYFSIVSNTIPEIFSLAGISEPLSGFQNLTSREVFNFSPGDVFHTKEKHWDWLGVTGDYCRVSQVLESNWAPSGDSVMYRIARFTRQIQYSYGETFINYIHDTINQTYLFGQFDYINLYPEQVIYNEYDTGYFSGINCMYQSSTTKYNFRRVKSSLRDWWSYYNCIIHPMFEEQMKYYIEGCGEYSTTYQSDYGRHPFGWSIELQYYSKGADTWGIPFEITRWNSLDSISPNQFFLYPNPSGDMVTFEISSFDNSSYHMEIYSVAGNKLDEIPISNKRSLFSVSKYSAGIYFLKLYKYNKIVGYQKLIRF